MDYNAFIQTIWSYYQQHKREFAWRQTDDPYHIVVSEIMLQQTQTHRVEKKFDLFIQHFPTIADLAQASLLDVLRIWQGLGYNRRAKSLHELARIIVQEYQAIIPNDPEILQELPGIGKNTAGSICAFAFNKPVIFIETNIRTVFIHFFFKNLDKIKDIDLIPLIEQTIDKNNPRAWYYALMDYGAMLKKNIPNPSRASAHYAQQSRFEGSDRQIRGMILRILAQNPTDLGFLYANIAREPERIDKALNQLILEGFIAKNGPLLAISNRNN